MASRTTTSDAERRWLRVLGTLNESQARLFVAEKALELGRGGISRLSELTGMSRPTIYKGAAQLRRKGQMLSGQAGRIRRGGAGRKRVEEVAPALKRELTRIVEETTAGDPMSLLKWTSQVYAHDRRGAQPPRPCGERGHRRALSARHGLLAAGQRQDSRGRAASGPRRAVSPHQRAGESLCAAVTR